jgi:hypothetical protein
MPEEVKKEKPKGPLGKLKEKVEDADEQLAVLSTLVRLGILIWSGGILTLNYVTIPGLPRSNFHSLGLYRCFSHIWGSNSKKIR